MVRMSPASSPEDPTSTKDGGAWVRALFWFAVVTLAVMSLFPGERLPAFTASIWDKAQHAGGFALLAVLGLWGYAGFRIERRVHAWRVLLGLMAFGIAIEFAQAATGWRHGDAADAVADAVGLVLGWGCVRVAGRWWALRDSNTRPTE